MFKNKATILFSSAIATICFACAASSQSLDPRYVLNNLTPENSGPMVRSMRESGTLQITETQMVHYLDLPTVNISVAFDGDTAFLTAQDMIALRSVAAVLKNPELEDQRFQVAAHYVNAKAPASVVPSAYRRANTVVEHLVAFYEIDPSRLIAVGYGAVDPSDPGNPMSPINSRIELINISAQ